MATEFILQGLTPRAHVDAIGRIFDVGPIDHGLIAVAFVTEGGVRLIEAMLAAHGKKISVFAGIRNDLTSRQGIERLLATGVRVFTVDTAQQARIYHPKIYCARSADSATLIVGSPNLTSGGLNNNVEASAFISLDLTNAEHAASLAALQSVFDSLPIKHPHNVRRITASVDVDTLWAAGLLVDERSYAPPRTRGAADGSKVVVNVPRMVFETPFIVSLSSSAAPLPAGKIPSVVAPAPTGMAVAPDYQPVWQSRPLERSNLNLVTSETGHSKNVLSLGQGGWATPIDYLSYFRDDVFHKLAWSTNGSVELAQAQFEFVLSSINYGAFDLMVSHTLPKAGANPKRQNATRLRWGKLGKLMKGEANLGKVLTLSRSVADPKRFLIVVD